MSLEPDKEEDRHDRVVVHGEPVLELDQPSLCAGIRGGVSGSR
jgi:hypothetical protein